MEMLKKLMQGKISEDMFRHLWMDEECEIDGELKGLNYLGKLPVTFYLLHQYINEILFQHNAQKCLKMLLSQNQEMLIICFKNALSLQQDGLSNQLQEFLKKIKLFCKSKRICYGIITKIQSQ